MQDNDRTEPTPEQIKHLLQEAVLLNYPNPERRGCLDRPLLRQVAEQRLPYERSEWEHITHCSPCYAEFLELRAMVLQRRRSRRRITVAAAGAIAAALVAAVYYAALAPPAPRVPPTVAKQSSEAPSHSGDEKATKTLTAVLNMQSASPTRGSDDGHPGPRTGDLQRLPRGRMAPLLIYLPFASEPGAYEVRVTKHEGDSAAMATFAGSADLRDGLTVLRVSPDLSSFAPGTYVLTVLRDGTRRWSCRFVLF